jgi:dimeric dUTPase (all-alpha-NTP-PPase superfamily)
MDMLKAIMEKQLELQTRLGTNFATMSDEDRAAFMRNHRGYLADEVAEALYEMPNYKLWKDYSNVSPEARGLAWQKVRMELVDSLHFFVNLLLCAGFTAEELYEMYMAKNAENHRRQDAGYTADTSYRDQAVEDVMKPHCTITMNGETNHADTFIAMTTDEYGGCGLFMNTDTVTLGMAASILYDAFVADLKTMSEEDRKAVNTSVMEAMHNYREANNG